MIFRTIVRVLRSLRFTIFLIICLISVFIFGIVIPQKDLLGREQYLAWKNTKPGLVSFLELIHFNEIYTSPLTLILWALFFLNLILVMTKRVPVIWKRFIKEDIPQNTESVKRNGCFQVLEVENFDKTLNFLKGSGYRVSFKDNAFWAVKNRLSPLATILFHLSFLLLLLGGVMSFYTEFRAEADVAVGETFTGNYRWVKRAKFGGIPQTTFMVEQVKPVYYQKNLPVDLKVFLRTENGREVIGINRPYKEGSLSFVIQDIDVAPLFIMKDEKGREIDGAFFKLILLGGKEDSFHLKGYEFRTVFYTDILAVDEAQIIEGESMPQVSKQFTDSSRVVQHKEIVNPAFRISVLKDGALVAEKTIRKNESIRFNNHSLVFSDLVYWIKFYVAQEQGLGIIYAGFVLMTAALIIRFVFYRRDIRGVLENEKLYVSGRGEFYPALFKDEFTKIVSRLRMK